MAKLMAPNIRIDWYPEGHFADIQNPTVAELNSGYNLSCAIVTGYTLDFTDSNTEDTTTIFDDFTSETILNHSYEADLQFFLAPRDSIAGNEEAYRKAEELFYVDQNPKGYLAKRFGFPGDSKYVGNQKVDLFLLQADLPKVLSEEDNPVLLNIRFLPQGEAVSGVTVVGQLVKVTAVEPTWKDSPNPYLKGGGTWSTPAVEGVIYDRPSGSARGGETITVSARPKTGYELTGSTSWSHTFPERLPWITYEWEGEPHNSPSIKRDHTGQIVARNLALDPRFEGGTDWWNSFTATKLPNVERGDIFDGLSESDWIGTAASATFNNVDLWQRFYSMNIEPGQWVAIRSLMAATLGSRVRQLVHWETENGTEYSYNYRPSVAAPSGEEQVDAYQAPAGTSSFTVRFQANRQDATGDLQVYVGDVVIAVADSEQAALDQVAEYFDGDTPDEYL